ncbi:MAG: hypothetical protein GF317_23165 [Candidatus Lokiarchaeota archaeon]|nr:hypothetical protein [Candidatus Lokiarchaeota archaeon]
MNNQSKRVYIKNARRLFKEISKYKLFAALIPKQNFNLNIAKILLKRPINSQQAYKNYGVQGSNEWDIIRKTVYKEYSYTCNICGAKNTQLHAHELWKYNYEEETQKLRKIVCLCRLCHLHQHLGFANILIHKHKLDEKEYMDHWIKINGSTFQDFTNYAKKVFELWEIKNMFDFKVVDCKEKPIDSSITINQILKCI